VIIEGIGIMPKGYGNSFDAAPLDSYAERITTGIAMLGGLITLPALFLYLSGMLLTGIAVTGVVITLAVALALAVWLVLNYAVQPASYLIENDRLVIKRRWVRAIPVPLKQIAAVSTAAALAEVPRFGLRRSFNAGVFGYQGPFQLERYGAVFFIATNRDRLVAVARHDRPPLIISPSRPRDFIEALREELMSQAEAEAVTGQQDDKVTR
jgi:Bacterial PH domain